MIVTISVVIDIYRVAWISSYKTLESVYYISKFMIKKHFPNSSSKLQPVWPKLMLFKITKSRCSLL